MSTDWHVGMQPIDGPPPVRKPGNIVADDRGPSHERLLRALRYDPDTGLFVWNENRAGRPLIGKRAGSENNGYIRISFDGAKYFAHRLAWLYVYKTWPSLYIDHIDGDRKNNRIANLRIASGTDNGANRRCIDGRLKGATFLAQENRWQSNITKNGVQYFLGCYPTAEEAHAAYCGAARVLHGEFARFK